LRPGEQGPCRPLVVEAGTDLARVVEGWDGLPLHIRTSILALVAAADK
jgi:hypothetical protein